jgi:cell division protein FtsL
MMAREMRVARLNLLLLFLAIACALGVVTSQHKARKLFVELQKEQELARKMEVEWGQLQLEQSTWAMPTRVEKIASLQLQMQLPKGEKIQFVRMGPETGSMKQGAGSAK